MANVLNKIAAYFLATALIFVLLEGYCSADNTYRYGNYYDEDVSGMIEKRFQNENDTTNTTTLAPPLTNATTLAPPPTNATTLAPPPTNATTLAPPPTNATTLAPPPTNATTLAPPPTNATTLAPPPTNATTLAPPPTNATTPTPPPTNATTPRPVPPNGTEFSDSVSRGQIRTYSLELPANGLTIKLNTTQGAITGYYSFSNSQPNATANNGQLNSNGTTTVRRTSSLVNVKQAVSQVYIAIIGTEVNNQFVVTANPAEAPPGDSAVSLYINVSATALCLILCTFTSQFIS